MHRLGFFIVGTDTDVGKTYVSCELLRVFAQLGFSTAALKPIASGCIKTPSGLRSKDALLLQRTSTLNFIYDEVNPFAFEPPVSPNIAAKLDNKILTTEEVFAASQPILMSIADLILVESAGGWNTPINYQETMADLALRFNFPIILVVAIRLGCINHTLLTYESIQNRGIPCAGWIANRLNNEVANTEEVIDYLREKLPCKLLEILSWCSKLDATRISSRLNIIP